MEKNKYHFGRNYVPTNQSMNIIDKTRMFSSDHCENQVASSKIMEIHNRTFHGEVKNYTCDLCCHQVSLKNSLARHKKSIEYMQLSSNIKRKSF